MNSQRKLMEISLRRITLTMLDTCLVKKVKETIIVLGTAKKSSTNKPQAKESIKDVHSKHLEMKT
jgi:hypothetical protein